MGIKTVPELDNVRTSTMTMLFPCFLNLERVTPDDWSQ